MYVFKKLAPLTWFIILIVIATILAIVTPPNPDTLKVLHISSTIYRAAILTLILPYVIIWFSAFYAYDKLDQYAKKIHRTDEEKSFKCISRSVGIMAWGLAIPTIISLILDGITAAHPGFAAAHAVISNYIAVAVPLIGFTVLNSGTNELVRKAQLKPGRFVSHALIFVFVGIGVFFVYFVMHNHYARNPYHLAMVPLLLTLVIPYIYSWLVGLFSAYQLWLFAHKAVGLLYRQALLRLSIGIAFVVATSIAVQYLTSVFAGKTNISLSTLLIIMYALLAVQASGYAMIALSAKRLKMIEEV